jgi:hypothetical protein
VHAHLLQTAAHTVCFSKTLIFNTAVVDAAAASPAQRSICCTGCDSPAAISYTAQFLTMHMANFFLPFPLLQIPTLSMQSPTSF